MPTHMPGTSQTRSVEHSTWPTQSSKLLCLGWKIRILEAITAQTLWAAVGVNEWTGVEEAAVLLAWVEGVPGAVGGSSTGVQAGRASSWLLRFFTSAQYTFFLSHIPGDLKGYADQLPDTFAGHITL